jgi:hypothetical protein
LTPDNLLFTSIFQRYQGNCCIFPTHDNKLNAKQVVGRSGVEAGAKQHWQRNLAKFPEGAAEQEFTGMAVA